jgi:hypothetical protein
MTALAGNLAGRPTGHNPARWLLGMMALVGLACVPGIILFQSRRCGAEQYPPAISPAIGYVLTLSGILGIVNGIVIAFRQPHNRIGLLCETTGVVGLVTAFANRYALCGIYGDFSLPAVPFAAWVSYLLAPVVIALVFWQISFWFPYGRYLSAGWRGFAMVMWAVLLVGVLLVGLLPGPLADNGVMISFPVENPFGLPTLNISALYSSLPLLIVGVLISTSLAANLSLVLRWRKASGDERQQIKWFAFFAGVVVSLFLVLEITGQFFFTDLFRSPAYVIGFALAWIGFPVVIGLSVLKYRLYDIDIVIRRTLAYAALSILLALVYLASITVLQLLFAGISGQQSQAAIVISTLIIAALFNPLRRTLQNMIDRRFYRSRYDAARILELFSASARDEVDMQQLLESLENAVDETLQPEAVSVWLARAPERFSTSGKSA